MSWAFYLVTVPAVIILGVGKGGFAGIGMVALPMMALVMPPLEAASILMPLLLVQDVTSAWAYRRTWDGRALVTLIPPAGVGVFLAYLLASRISVSAVELVVGMITVVFAGNQLLSLPGDAPDRARRPGLLLGLIAGAAAGFTSMLANAGAPPFQLYMIPQRLARDVFVGTSVIAFTAINFMKIGPFIALGTMTSATLRISATLLPIAVLSTWLGVYLIRRTSGSLFYTIIYLLMLAIGMTLTLRGLSGL